MNHYEENQLRKKAEEDARSRSNAQAHRPWDFDERKIYDEAYLNTERDMEEENNYTYKGDDTGVSIALIGGGIILVLLIAMIAIIAFVIFQAHLIGYSVKYTPYKIAIPTFILTALCTIYLGKGRSVFWNFFLYLASFVFATRSFISVVEKVEGIPYTQYVHVNIEGFSGFWYLAKYTIFYMLYVAVFLIIIKLLIMLVRKAKSY